MLNIVYPYYTNKSLLLDQLKRWCEYSDFVKSNINIIIVDDGSPHSEAHHIITTSEHKPNIPITLLKINEDILWNTAGSRNLGMHYIQNKNGQDAVVFLSLMDAILPEDTIVSILKDKHELNLKKCIYKLKRRDIYSKEVFHEHHSLLLLTPASYFSVGGLDEDFSGAYGHDDDLFMFTIKKYTNLEVKTLDCFVEQYQQGPEERFDYEYKFNSDRDHRINISRNRQILQHKTQQTFDQLLSSKNIRFEWNTITSN